MRTYQLGTKHITITLVPGIMGNNWILSQRIVVVCLVFLLAGCIGMGGSNPATESPTSSDSEETTYVVFTEKLSDAPDGVTVVEYNNTSLQDANLTKKYIVSTYKDGGLTERIGEAKRAQLDTELRDVPRNEGADFGYYFEYRESIIRVYIGVEE